MPNTLAKNLNLCFTKIKLLSSPDSPPFPPSTTSFFVKNFNSLYDFTFDSNPATTSKLSAAAAAADAEEHYSTDCEPETGAVPDFASAFASQRFFFSSPGRSNSIIDSSSVSSSTSSATAMRSPDSESVVGESVAVPTYSPDPFSDFRRSMQEMVEARDLMDVRANWNYLHELLMCYLALNPKCTHKYIVGAFADLLVSLMTSQADNRRKSQFPGDT